MKILETVKNFIKKNKKLVTVVSAMFCAVVLVAGSIAGTIAYLTDNATVTNTFTVGNVSITLNESKVNEYGELVTGADPVTANEYKLIPGHTYVKDPKITVDAGSENCYLFVKVTNGLSAIEASGDTTIAKQLENNGWKLVTSKSDIWYYGNTVANGDSVAAGTVVPTFANFTISGTSDVSTYGSAEIVVTAYAIQSNGFDSANAAWSAAVTAGDITTP